MKTRKGYLIKRGKVFHAAWTISGRKIMKTTGKTNRRDAETELSRIMQPFLIEDEKRMLENVKARIEGATGEITALNDARNPPPTLLASWTAYLESPNRPDSGEETLKQYESHFDQFCKWLKDNQPEVKTLRVVTQDIATAYATYLNTRKLSGNRFNKHIRFLELLFRVLQDSTRLTLNPWGRIRRKQQQPNSRRELTIEELRNVCIAAPGDMKTLFALGLYTGLRLGDCATLRWAEVDLARGQIRRTPNKTARHNPKPVLVPIHLALSTILKESWKPRHGEYVLPEIAAEYMKNPSELSGKIQILFTVCGVTTIKPGTGVIVTRDVNGKKRKEYTGKRAVVEVGFHSLRHTFVSLCRGSNAPLSVVESIVGHASPAMTRHYTHVGETAAGEAVALLPDITGTRAPQPADKITVRSELNLNAIKKLANELNAKNWQQTKAILQKLVAARTVVK